MISVSHSSSNANRWYVVHTSNQKKVKSILQGCDGISEVYLPLQHKVRTRDRKIVARPLFTSYVFVRGQLDSIRSELRYVDNASVELDATRDYHHPMVISDEEMDNFKLICDEQEDIELLKNPYQSFLRVGDEAEIISGKYQGFSGIITNIRRDLKLVMRLGQFGIALTGIQRFDVRVKSNHVAVSSKTARLALLVDYFKEILQGHQVSLPLQANSASLSLSHPHIVAGRKNPFFNGNNEVATRHEAAAIFRSLLALFQLHRSRKQIAEQLLKNNQHISHADAVRLSFLSVLTDGDEKDFAYLSTFATGIDLHSEEHFPLHSDGLLRPMFTPTAGCALPRNAKYISLPIDDSATELILPVDMQTCGSDTKSAHPIYYAHLAIQAEDDGQTTLMTNWEGFYPKFRAMATEDKQAFLTKLRKYHLGVFYTTLVASLTDDEAQSLLPADEQTRQWISPETIRFIDNDKLKISGLGMIIQTADREQIEAVASKLIVYSQLLVEEINQSSRLRPWQKTLCQVWLRPDDGMPSGESAVHDRRSVVGIDSVLRDREQRLDRLTSGHYAQHGFSN